MGGGKSGTGTFAFDFLTKSLQGFEDETVKTITTGKANWRGYFESLEQMALKFALNKTIGSLFKLLSDTSFGKSLGLGDVLGAANPSQIANTTALTANSAATLADTTVTGVVAGALAVTSAALIANTAALVANTGAQTASLGAHVAGMIPMFAEGTDFAPGGMSIVGERGPEVVNLPRGSSVTPNSMLRAGSLNFNVQIDAKGAEIGVEEKISRALETAMPMMVMRAVVEGHERTMRSLGNR